MSWRHIWGRIRVEIGTDHRLARVAAPAPVPPGPDRVEQLRGIDVGVPARGLHGEAYRGHVFWDELFILPFLSLRFPQLTRRCCSTATAALDQARRARRGGGLRRCDVPVAERSNGREETQTVHLNPKSGRWLPDASHLQRHVERGHRLQRLAVLSSNRRPRVPALLRREMMLEIARFWAEHRDLRPHARPLRDPRGDGSRRVPRAATPIATEPGLDNNAYTNVMAVWCLLPRLRRARRVCRPSSVRELSERLEITEQELDRWERHQPQDEGLLPRRRDQPVRGLRAARGARLARLPASTATSNGSIASSKPKATPPTATRSASSPTSRCSSSCSRPTSSQSCSSGSATTSTTI